MVDYEVEVDLLRGQMLYRRRRICTIICTSIGIFFAIFLALVVLPSLTVYIALVISSTCYLDCRNSTICHANSKIPLCLDVCWSKCWNSKDAFVFYSKNVMTTIPSTSTDIITDAEVFASGTDEEIVHPEQMLEEEEEATTILLPSTTSSPSLPVLLAILSKGGVSEIDSLTNSTTTMIQDVTQLATNFETRDDVVNVTTSMLTVSAANVVGNETVMAETVTLSDSTIAQMANISTDELPGKVTNDTEQRKLFEACYEGDVTQLQSLFATKHVDLNAAYDSELHGSVSGSTKWKNGTTCLMFAASRMGNDDILNFLAINAQNRENVDRQDQDGRTALHYAARAGFNTTVHILCKILKANVEIKDINGSTPLMKAASSGRCEIVQFLLENGADVAEKDNNGWTSLHVAANNGRLDVCRLLLDDGGADVDATSNDGENPLMLAVKKNHLDIVRLLEAKGATRTI